MGDNAVGGARPKRRKNSGSSGTTRQPRGPHAGEYSSNGFNPRANNGRSGRSNQRQDGGGGFCLAGGEINEHTDDANGGGGGRSNRNHGRDGRKYENGNPNRDGHIQNRNGRRENDQPVAKPFPLGDKRLAEILLLPPEELVMQLAGGLGRGYEALLALTDARAQSVVTINRLLAVIARVTTSKLNRANMLAVITKFLFSDILCNVLGGVPMQHMFSGGYSQNFDEFLGYFITVVTACLECTPRLGTEKLCVPLVMVEATIKKLRMTGMLTVNEAKINELEEIKAKCDSISELMLQRKPENGEDEEDPLTALYHQPPPNNFREMSVVPTREDIHAVETSFLRPNVISGGYTDDDHYLDVQFRLLREDFMRPLRMGIKEYLAMSQQGRNRNARLDEIRMYYDVRVTQFVFTMRGIQYEVKFDLNPLKGVKWEATKRLLPGSLVVLSRDNFETFVFASIVSRDEKYLKQGLVCIELYDDLPGTGPSFNQMMERTFVMAETVAYFEAYSHVLKRLQSIERVPFSQYIVSVSTESKCPAYLNRQIAYDLDPLLAKDGLLGQTKTIVLSEMSWPTAAQLNLNRSQFKAFRSALTKEFVVLQGPPGTGKTYVGLKIAQALLFNKQVWESAAGRKSSMLIICYTNHALDQFLEGIIAFEQSVIRVGGRSKNENLAQYNIGEKRQNYRNERCVSNEIYRAQKQNKQRMKDIEEQLKSARDNLGALKTYFLTEDQLGCFMTDAQRTSMFELFPFNYKPNCYMADWLRLTDMSQSRQELRVQELPQIENLELEEEEEEEVAEDIAVVAVEGERGFLIDQRIFDDDMEDGFAVRGRRVERNAAPPAQDNSNRIKLEDLMAENDIGAGDGFVFQRPHQKKMRERNKRYLKDQLSRNDAVHVAIAEGIEDIWLLSLDDRWRLYRHWLNKYRRIEMAKIKKVEEEYNQAAKCLKEWDQQIDLELLRKASVIGMTTTGAAKYHSLLENVRPPIVIVEEAAEVLESQVVTALTDKCMHLILIGDHQQLRPNPTVYELCKKFNMDISLFERMVKNDLHYDRLAIQHRMRPEFSTLLVPHFYSDLEDHHKVSQHPHIKGLQSDLLFLCHSEHESSTADTKSKSNSFEAKMIVGLCRYLIHQGYKPTQITILCMYLGQLFEIKKLMPQNVFEGVRVAVVDNYQGEENDIVLLSLVRSNTDGQIGFLKADTRICVSLSRAKHGMYVVGNFDLMKEKSKHWHDIVDKVKAMGFYGNSFNLVCQNHPENVTAVMTPKDFESVPEGGCKLPCDYRLSCGHQCPMLCHPYDREHLDINCSKPCARQCRKGHQCQKRCSADCGNCFVPVEAILPVCRHAQEIACYMDPARAVCKNPCSRYLGCDHKCGGKCGEPCKTDSCSVLVKGEAECGHFVDFPCMFQRKIGYEKDLVARCMEACKVQLMCGHTCKGNCFQCKQGRLHLQCKEKCTRQLVCGHLCPDPCSKACQPCRKNCVIKCVHSKCPKKCSELCAPCAEHCEWVCEHKMCTKRCRDVCDRTPCDEPCNKKLKCEHMCIGLCGEPCPPICRQCNKNHETFEVFFGTEEEEDSRFVLLEDCKHVMEVTGLDYWMKNQRGGTEGGNSVVIKMVECPKCKTPVYKSLRYGNYVKAAFNDVLEVKGRVCDYEILQQKKVEIVKAIEDKLANFEEKKEPTLRDRQIMRLRGVQPPKPAVAWSQKLRVVVKYALMYMRDVLSDVRNLPSKDRFNIAENIIQFLTQAEKLVENHSNFGPLEKQIDWLLSWMFSDVFVNKNRISEQELEDYSWEMKRTCMIANLHKCVYYKDQRDYIEVEQILLSQRRYGQEEQSKVTDVLKKFAPLSDEEKVMIIAATRMSSGHWYMCPNRHTYLIENCGQPNQRSVCNVCQAAIGGGTNVVRDVDMERHVAVAMSRY